MPTRTNLITKSLEPFDVRQLPYEAVEFAHDELREMATRLRFGGDCLPDGVPAQKQIRADAEMLERRAADLIYEHCEHEFETMVQQCTADGLAERFRPCKRCGAESREDSDC
jgi:hypothetical protein